MKFPPFKASSLLLLRFPLILGLFAVVVIVGHRTISSVTDGLGSNLYMTSRLEEAAHAEMELNDLIGKSYRFAAGDPGVKQRDVLLALDVFWSRINVLETNSYRRALTDAGVARTEVISDMAQALPLFERAVKRLRFGEPESYGDLRALVLRFHGDFMEYSEKSYAVWRSQSRSMVASEIESLDNLKVLQLEYAGLACLTVLYVLFELYLSRRGNRKLNLAIAEKQHLLVSDHLTGVGNRLQFENALARRKTTEEFSLVMLDLDGFKGVNDTLGHAAGDHLLKYVAAVLSSSCGMDDVVCRLGGDEFAVLLGGRRERADTFANRVLRRLEDSVLFEGKQIRAATSIGVAHTRDTRIDTTVCLLRNADAALYAAKAAGRNCVRFTTPAIVHASNRKRRLQGDLKQAIAESRIDIAFQPIVSLHDKRAHAIEALLRWEHPEYGSVPPLEVIEAAEQTSQILTLTLYVIDRACAMRNHIAECGHDLQVTVNVSPGLMALPDFAEATGAVARRHEIRHGALLLEITEDAVMAENEAVGSNIERFRELGIYLAVDDFGKGYSNLSRLANLQFYTIKLDKSLIGGISTSGRGLDIVRGISRMASDLGVNIVAEGVETAEQAAILTEMGIALAQGYHFARPMTALALLGYLGKPVPVASDDAAQRDAG